ncbi:amidase [Pontimicrobium aquaticum]|uniref:Amidase n=1 Tax=Pontimicrobium aquaticum TaxID=2565367 RepID=A0A4U0EWS5_9FLAO|nr:amidase [Pontimicrobium aquaticum]TJY36383.1 amidase [Pontimicrobium aquaticum]
MFKKFAPVLILSVVCLFGCKDTTTQPQPIALEELTIANIHEAYKNGTYTSEALIRAYLEAIDSLNANINAITTINQNAIAQAQALDEEYKKTKVLRPLHGIPMIVKDNINTIGLPTTAGALALKDFIPEDDAFIIKQLKDAGAIILAKSNMAEWAFSAMHTKSSTGGTTRNPYNLDYVPAGSSGGTAAAIASNIGVIGLGTDTGNSIRGPSSHCALVGFRTTLGLISREGIAPLFLRNDVVGPMCRTVEDATRVMEVMAGYDIDDPITKNSQGQIPDNYTQFLDENGLKGARIGVLRELSDNNIDSDIEALFNTALTDLSALGATVIDPVVIPDFKSLSQDQWCAKFREDIEAYLARYVKRDTMKTLEDIIRVGTTAEFSSKRLSQYTTASGRWGNSGAECLDAYHDQRRIAFREAIEQVMDSLELDAIVYPTWNYKPARIDRFEEDYKGDNNQIIAPHTGQPAFTVPMGVSPGNLPVGLQFLGRMFDEPTLITLAYAYEQGTKHRTTPAKTY